MLKAPSSPKSTSTQAFSTPERPPIALTRRARYLYAVVALTVPHPTRDDLWHLMTSVPVKFTALCEVLEEELQLQKSKFVKPGPITNAFNILVENRKILETMFGTSGVYYTLTSRGDVEKMAFCAPHIAQAIIYEKFNGSKIKGRSHEYKGRTIHSALANNIDRLTRLHKQIATVSPNLTFLQMEIDKFCQYLRLHMQCLDLAFAYDHAAQKDKLDASLVPQCISPFVEQFHPGALKEYTPEKPTPSTVKALCTRYQQSRSAAAASAASAAAVYSTPKRSSVAAGITATSDSRATHLTPVTALTLQFDSARLTSSSSPVLSTQSSAKRRLLEI